MRAGWIGLGKLGLPCALTLAHYGGHEVTGYDVSDIPRQILTGQRLPHREQGLQELLSQSQLAGFQLASSAAEVTAASDVVVIAVQTPTRPGYADRADFDYAWLRESVSAVAEVAVTRRKMTVIIVLSTVLPGTMQREILPLGNEFTPMAYAPAFISLGTTIRDFRHPGFVNCGAEDPRAAAAVRELYAFTGAPVIECDFPTAEMIKMCSNMYDTLKITFAGMISEMAHRTGADSDVVTSVLRRFRSGTFPDPGMPDGGPCRPRDLLALSWLTGQLGMAWDLPNSIHGAREAHASWLAGLADDVARKTGLPVVLTGEAYKPATDLTDGSPALLVRKYLRAPVPNWDLADGVLPADGPAVFVVTVRYAQLASFRYPEGSVVIDPWGITPDQPGVDVVRVGRP